MGRLRRATDADSEGVIKLIGAIFAEYPGVILDVDLEEPELRAPATNFDHFWVIESDSGEIIGCIACTVKPQIVELKKLYVAKRERGEGHARRLVEQVERVAAEAGATEIEFWSDTRFKDAHGLYEHLGYERSGKKRALNDLSDTWEYHFIPIPGKPSGPRK